MKVFFLIDKVFETTPIGQLGRKTSFHGENPAWSGFETPRLNIWFFFCPHYTLFFRVCQNCEFGCYFVFPQDMITPTLTQRCLMFILGNSCFSSISWCEICRNWLLPCLPGRTVGWLECQNPKILKSSRLEKTPRITESNLRLQKAQPSQRCSPGIPTQLSFPWNLC